MERFYLDKLTLSNYRKFGHRTFQLKPGMNLFISKNASGKTTVLEAASVMLGAYLAAFKEYVPADMYRIFQMTMFEEKQINLKKISTC